MVKEGGGEMFCLFAMRSRSSEKKCKFSPTIPGHKPFLFKGISSKGYKGGKSLVKMA